ncbi:MAG: hypothetical protein GY804_11415 [Alphaproteobacteria bacterium]|nr:hypothetical protein [Alphaproteobacteria bacterium]
MSTGWIKLHRQFLDWEWYDDMNTKCLYLHCLLRANHSDAKWRGIDVKKGQFITSLDSLSSETGLSVQKIRTSLNKLKSTGNITSKQQAKARIITVVGWDDYQEVNKESNKQATGKQQATNRQLTPDKNVRSKECKNDKNNDIVAKAPKFNFKAELLALGVNPETLADWLTVRKNKKASNTKTAFNGLIREITKSGLMVNDAIEYAASKSWSGFKAQWYENEQPKHQGVKQYSDVTAQNINTIGEWVNE